MSGSNRSGTQKLPSANSENTCRTISTFSSDIARGVSPLQVLLASVWPECLGALAVNHGFRWQAVLLDTLGRKLEPRRRSVQVRPYDDGLPKPNRTAANLTDRWKWDSLHGLKLGTSRRSVISGNCGSSG